jgi:hypothetical protein
MYLNQSGGWNTRFARYRRAYLGVEQMSDFAAKPEQGDIFNGLPDIMELPGLAETTAVKLPDLVETAVEQKEEQPVRNKRSLTDLASFLPVGPYVRVTKNVTIRRVSQEEMDQKAGTNRKSQSGNDE